MYTTYMKTIRMWGPVVVWMAIIFVFSVRPSVSVSGDYWLNFLFFKTLHVLEYAVLYILTYRATKNPITSFIIVIVYAGSDEIHQLFVPTREGRVRDVIIDTLGAVAAWISIKKLLPKSPKKLRQQVRHWLAI
jgi:VanZ family protein